MDLSSFNFLIQSTKVLYDNKFDEDELTLIYDFLVSLDNEQLNSYYRSCSILSYENDLQLYIEIIERLLKIYENREEYEKCEILYKKLKESKIIINNK
jgi:hypothetical protein